MKYFKIKDFNCPCCGEEHMDTEFLEMLDNAREIAGVPFNLTSGWRCEKHNKEVGSKSKNHVAGKAVDISALYGPERGQILKGLYKAGFKRVGIRKDFIHADTMPSIESCWLY